MEHSSFLEKEQGSGRRSISDLHSLVAFGDTCCGCEAADSQVPLLPCDISSYLQHALRLVNSTDMPHL